MKRLTQVLVIIAGVVAFIAMGPVVISAPTVGIGVTGLLICTAITTTSVLASSALNDNIREDINNGW